MNNKLTKTQQELLKYFREKIAETGRAPSLRMAAGDLGVSHTAVAQILKTLEQKGMLRRSGRYGRTLHLLNPAGRTSGVQRFREVPVIGRITAGLPMYAQQEWEESIIVDSDFYKGENLFALRARGDSMKGAGILDGDLAICRPRQYAANAEIAAVLIDGEEATIKRFFLRPDHILLKPENPVYPPRRYGFDRILVQGLVIGIQRGPDVMQRL